MDRHKSKGNIQRLERWMEIRPLWERMRFALALFWACYPVITMSKVLLGVNSDGVVVCEICGATLDRSRYYVNPIRSALEHIVSHHASVLTEDERVKVLSYMKWD